MSAALNELNSAAPGSALASSQLNAAQRECMDRLSAAARAFGRPPAETSGQGALQELLAKQ
eukprot:12974152-Alexandrium_andersonii.AAC.1